jgi:hypothetical protein
LPDGRLYENEGMQFLRQKLAAELERMGATR